MTLNGHNVYFSMKVFIHLPNLRLVIYFGHFAANKIILFSMLNGLLVMLYFWLKKKWKMLKNCLKCEFNEFWSQSLTTTIINKFCQYVYSLNSRRSTFTVPPDVECTINRKRKQFWRANFQQQFCYSTIWQLVTCN